MIENEAATKNYTMFRNFQNYFQTFAFSRYENEAGTQIRIFQIIAHFPDLKTRSLLKCFAFSRLLRIFQIYVYLNVPQIPDSSAASRLFRTFTKIPQFSQRFRKFQLALKFEKYPKLWKTDLIGQYIRSKESNYRGILLLLFCCFLLFCFSLIFEKHLTQFGGKGCSQNSDPMELKVKR